MLSRLWKVCLMPHDPERQLKSSQADRNLRKARQVKDLLCRRQHRWRSAHHASVSSACRLCSRRALIRTGLAVWYRHTHMCGSRECDGFSRYAWHARALGRLYMPSHPINMSMGELWVLHGHQVQQPATAFTISQKPDGTKPIGQQTR